MFKIYLIIALLISSVFGNVTGNSLTKNELNIENVKYWNFNKFKNIKENSELLKKWVSDNNKSEFIIIDNISINESLYSFKGFFKEKCVKKSDNKNVCLLISPKIDNSTKFKFYKDPSLTNNFKEQPIFFKINNEKGFLLLSLYNSDEYDNLLNLKKYFAKVSKLNESDITVIADMYFKLDKKQNEIFLNIKDLNYIEDSYLTNKQKVITNSSDYKSESLMFQINKDKTPKEQLKIFKQNVSSYIPLTFKF